MTDVDRARRFVARNARLLDRHRFAHLIDGGPAEPVLRALRAHANDDGGFGHALEPDLRSPSSQPGAVQHAIEMLDECDATDDPMLRGACDFLLSAGNRTAVCRSCSCRSATTSARRGGSRRRSPR